MSSDIKLTDAQTRAVRELEAPDGTLTPEQVVEAAKDPASPLHPLFDWNNREAAAKWRLHQARIVIGSVRVLVTTEEAMIKAPVYVVDMEAEGSGYKNVQVMRRSPGASRASLIYTLKVAAGHLQRARDLSGPLGLLEDIEELIEQVTGLVQRLDFIPPTASGDETHA